MLDTLIRAAVTVLLISAIYAPQHSVALSYSDLFPCLFHTFEKILLSPPSAQPSPLQSFCPSPWSHPHPFHSAGSLLASSNLSLVSWTSQNVAACAVLASRLFSSLHEGTTWWPPAWDKTDFIACNFIYLQPLLAKKALSGQVTESWRGVPRFSSLSWNCNTFKSFFCFRFLKNNENLKTHRPQGWKQWCPSKNVPDKTETVGPQMQSFECPCVFYSTVLHCACDAQLTGLPSPRPLCCLDMERLD